MTRAFTLICALLVAAPAFAQWPDKPKNEPSAPAATTPAPAAAPAPAPTPPPHRADRSAPHEDNGSGFTFGVRGAWAMPFGSLTQSEGLGDNVTGQMPIWVEAGWNFNKSFFAGAYYQYAFSINDCNPGADCSSHAMRFGLEALYNFMPDGTIQPWAGLGVGYEILSLTRSGDDRTFKGLELLNLQLGVDWAASKNFSIGPFASYQLFGKYTSFTSGGISNDIGDTTGHSWLQLGLKATVHL